MVPQNTIFTSRYGNQIQHHYSLCKVTIFPMYSLNRGQWLQVYKRITLKCVLHGGGPCYKPEMLAKFLIYFKLLEWHQVQGIPKSIYAIIPWNPEIPHATAMHQFRCSDCHRASLWNLKFLWTSKQREKSSGCGKWEPMQLNPLRPPNYSTNKTPLINQRQVSQHYQL